MKYLEIVNDIFFLMQSTCLSFKMAQQRCYVRHFATLKGCEGSMWDWQNVASLSVAKLTPKCFCASFSEGSPVERSWPSDVKAYLKNLALKTTQTYPLFVFSS